MDFNYSPEDEAFRKEVREWLEENLPQEWRRDRYMTMADRDEWVQVQLAWQKKRYEKGWLAPTWPKEYGGGGLTMMQTVILDEEFTRANAPQAGVGMGLSLIGPTILAVGTEEQKRHYIPRILSAEDIWCQGFSEPNAGSDLASLQCKAVVDGDDYVINGQKTWSTGAHRANMCFLLVRTDPNAVPKHRGITYLLVDMRNTPGIEVRPLKQITGSAEFNEIFFDNVRVPRSNVLGQENRGWYVAMATLGYERSSTSQGIIFKRSLEELTKLAAKKMRNGRPAIEDPSIRELLAQCAAEIQVVVLNGYRLLTNRIKGQVPGPEAQMTKVFWSEMNERMANLALEILGPEATLQDDDEDIRRWQMTFLSVKASTISMGTSEIIRNIIGERILGLPR